MGGGRLIPLIAAGLLCFSVIAPIVVIALRPRALGRLLVDAVVRIGLEFCPDGHPKLLHLWPVKLLQAGRSDYDYVGVMAMREAASFRR